MIVKVSGYSVKVKQMKKCYKSKCSSIFSAVPMLSTLFKGSLFSDAKALYKRYKVRP